MAYTVTIRGFLDRDIAKGVALTLAAKGLPDSLRIEVGPDGDEPDRTITAFESIKDEPETEEPK